MKSLVRKQVYLTHAQNESLRREAARQRRSEAEILREALDRHLGPRRTSARSDDALLGIVGIGASETPDLSGSIDEILYGAKRR